MPPLVWVVVAWVVGLIAAHHCLVPLGVAPQTLAILTLLPVGTMLLWRKDRSLRLGAVCALALLAGALRYQAALPRLGDPGVVAHYNDRGWAVLEGVVRDYPDARDTWTNLRLDAEWLEIEGERRPVHGTVLVRASSFPESHYGDRLRVSGQLQTPAEFEGFSYRDYLAREGIYSVVYGPQIERIATDQGNLFWAALFAVKDRARDAVARLMPDPEAALLQGILLGIRSGIPPDLYDDYNDTGTSHIIVISGSNISFVAAAFALTFGLLMGKRRAYWFTLAGIVLYVLLVGADMAVVRAGLMGGLLITAIYLGRRSTAYVALCASALALTLITPLALWDAGFQLSFAATLGLILLAPPLERLFEKGWARLLPANRSLGTGRYLNQTLALTLAAQALTLPLVITHFGRLPLIAPLANLLILPVQPLVMAAGGGAIVIGLIPALEPLARILAWLPWLCLAYTNAVVRWLASWPLATLEIDRGQAAWLLAICAALGISLWLWHHRRPTARSLWQSVAGRRSAAVLLGGPLVVALLAWLAVLQLPDGRLHVAFLDVGQGDAVLITTPSGQQILVDGGPSPSALTAALGREVPFWDRSLDVLVMTHPDADHIAGLVEVLDRFGVEGWLDNGQPGGDALYAEGQRRLLEHAVPRYVVRRGDLLDLGRGIVLEVLHPPPEPMDGTTDDANNNSLVLRLAWQGASFLLAGDVEAEAERLLLVSGQPLSAMVLKVAHHGSNGSSTADFLGAVDPVYAVVSVGADNRFGHPDPAVLERLAGLTDVTVLRTDQQGTVEFVTDGWRLWVHTER